MKMFTVSITLAIFLLSAAVVSAAESVKIAELNNKKEYVLIKNEGKAAVNLKGWQVHDYDHGKSKKYVCNLPAIELKPGETLQLQSGISKKVQKQSPQPSKRTDCEHYLLWSNSRVWNDGGDIAYLRDGSGTLIDEKQSGKITDKTPKKK